MSLPLNSVLEFRIREGLLNSDHPLTPGGMMGGMDLIQFNLQKIRELQKFCHEPVHSWMKVCFAQGLEFKIEEAWRTQQRQNWLYAQGRTRKGKIVTWTRNSVHIQRLAMDLYPVPGMKGQELLRFYIQLDELAVPYGICRPIQLIKLGDFGHYETVRAQMPIPPPTKEQQMSTATERIKLLKGNIRARAIQRYKEIYGKEPVI